MKIRINKRIVKLNSYLVCILAVLGTWLITSVIVQNSNSQNINQTIMVWSIIGFATVMLFKRIIYEKKFTSIDIVAAGFIVKLNYIMMTNYAIAPHDLGAWVDKNNCDYAVGHVGYIAMIFHKGISAFDIDPTSRWSFYNPPLHHTITALWNKLNKLLGFSDEVMVENMQYLSLLWCCLSVIIIYKIVSELTKNESIKKVIIAAVAFHPYFIFTSGNVNNDALATMLSLLAILYTIKWSKNNSYKNIIVIALAMGLGMMTKVSVALVAPAIAFVFAFNFFAKKKKRMLFVKEFCTFLLVSVPLGMWWPIRNSIKYGMDLFYAQKLLDNMPQYIRDAGVLERIVPRLSDFNSAFINFNNPINDSNIFVTMFKNSLFCDFTLCDKNSWLYIVCFALLITTVILTIVIMVYWVSGIVKNGFKNKQMGIFSIIGFITLMIFYVRYCFKETFICTQDFRYIVPAIVFVIIGIMQSCDVENKENLRFAQFFVCIFAILSTVVYLFAINI